MKKNIAPLIQHTQKILATLFFAFCLFAIVMAFLDLFSIRLSGEFLAVISYALIFVSCFIFAKWRKASVVDGLLVGLFFSMVVSLFFQWSLVAFAFSRSLISVMLLILINIFPATISGWLGAKLGGKRKK